MTREDCGAEQCIFCAFAGLARLHPQRLALLQPHRDIPWQAQEYNFASKASENRNLDERKGDYEGLGHCCKPVISESTTESCFNTCASEDLSSDPLANSRCFKNEHLVHDGDKVFAYSTVLDLADALAVQIRTLISGISISSSSKASQDPDVIHLQKTVGILIGSSVEYVVAILAVLQSGLAFVPLEPSWPARRIATVLEDSEPFFLLTNQQDHEAVRDFIKDSSPLSILCFDLEYLVQSNGALSHHNGAGCSCFCHTSMAARRYCYVIYTSGSSGKPKGVLGTETGLLHRLQWMQKEYPFLESDIAIFKTSVSFVDHLTELLGPLLGGCLVVVPPFEELFRNPLSILHFLQAYSITRLTAVPSLMRAVLPSLSVCPRNHALLSVQVLVLSGEVLPYDLFKLVQALLPHATILNLYGCSEVSGDCLFFDTKLFEHTYFDHPSVPIGKPLPGCMLEVVTKDSEHEDEGELWVGGVLVALGYRNELCCRDDTFDTDDKFTITNDPCSAHYQVQFFKTGDFVKRLSDGNFLFLGRKDRIVKVNGKKVSLDEIESVLATHSLVTQCAINFQTRADSESTIVAHVVCNPAHCFQEAANVNNPGNSGIVSSLRVWLYKRLPREMIPGRWIFVEMLPYLSSGKIDYQALSEFKVSRPMTTNVEALEAEASSLTQHIKRTFELVLKVDSISVHDDFFSLGGTSVSAAHAAHILDIDMRVLYTHSSAIELEPVLRASQKIANMRYLASDLGDCLPDIQAFKLPKKDQSLYASDSVVLSVCNKQTLSIESSNSKDLVQDGNWQLVGTGDDAPKALYRCNVCVPREPYLSQHWFILNTQPITRQCSLSILWKVQLKACVDASPVLLRHQSMWLAYVGSHAHNFMCVNASNGNVIWEERVGGRVESTAAIASDLKHVIVGSYDGYIHVFGSERGACEWKFQTKAEVKCQPTVDWRGIVWCGSHDHHLYALCLEERRCVWEHDCEASIFGAVAHDSSRLLAYVATTAGTVLAFRTDCFHLQTVWIHSCGAPIFGSLAVDSTSGYVICTLVNGKVMALTSSGSIIWEHMTGGPVFAGATLTISLPLQVLICSRDTWVYSLHLFSGICLWKYCLGEPITSSMYVDESLNLVNKELRDGIMYDHESRLVCACGASGQVFVLKVYAGSTTTKVSSSLHTGKSIHNTSSIYIEEFQYSSQRCELLATLKLPGNIFSSPIMLGGRIFVGCRDNNFYCLKLCGFELQAKVA